MMLSGTNSLANMPDVYGVTQPLSAGDNVLTHNLGSTPVIIQAWNNATNNPISFSLVGETLSTVTIRVAVAVASARIRFDV